MTDYINQEVIRMLKSGVDPIAIQQEIAEENRKSYSQDFVSFMQDMLEKYHVKRTQIARSTGISQDYLYKVLNGTKKTAEKDYVVAICIAAGMNIPETQHALSINEMAMLDRRDLREHLLLTCISEQRGIRKTNDWLENAGFPLLRVSKDMEQYVPSIQYEETVQTVSAGRKRLREITREVKAEHCGNAPFDYIYWANIIVEDENMDKYHVQGFFAPDFSVYSVLDEENYRLHEAFIVSGEEDDEPSWHTMEEYDDIEDAIDSDFLRYFLEIDRLTDDKVKEVLSGVCETANYGRRFGMKISGGKTMIYAEQYDAEDPASRQYYQIVETDGKAAYSISHESAFMWIEMGDIYSAVFGEREAPKYYFETDDESELNELPIRDRFILNALKTDLHVFGKKNSGGIVKFSDQTIKEEQMQSTAEVAAWSFMHGDYEKALEVNMHVYEMALSSEKEFNADNLHVILPTIHKIAVCHEKLGDAEQKKIWENRIPGYRDRLFEKRDSNDDRLKGAFSVYTEHLLFMSQYAQDHGDMEQMKEYTKEIIELLESRTYDNDLAGILTVAYIKRAYQLDEENNSEDAIYLYEKAEKLIRRHHLENGRFRRSIITFYNNYAWVLWNRFENEEAIIYYGKAIELTEDSIHEFPGMRESLIKSLQHYASGLYKLYTQTDKKKEADRLKKRMQEYEIDIEK